MADHEFVPFKKKGVWLHLLLEKCSQRAQCKLCKMILKIVSGSTKGLHERLKWQHDITLKRKADDGDGNSEQTSKGPQNSYYISAYDTVCD